MTALTQYYDPLCVSIDQPIHGENFPDNRSIWYGLTNITLDTGGISGAQWYQDSGPIGVADNIIEPRAFCTKGQATFSFAGVTLIVRLNIAFSYYTGATVQIDGVSPSTLGLLTALDTLSCDAATYSRTDDGYLDVLVADGLSDTEHTCVITVNSSDAAKFFSIAGFKVGGFTSQSIARNDGWVVPASTQLAQNKVTLTLRNRGTGTIAIPSLSFPSGLVTGTNTALTTLTAASLSPDQSISQVVLPVFVGTEISGITSYNLTLSADYPDASGSINHTVATTLLPDSSAITKSGTWWGPDNGAVGGVRRLYTSVTGSYLALTFVGDSLTLTVESTTGWGVMGVYASDNTTLLYSVPCNTTSDTIISSTHTGFGAGSHTVHLQNTDGLVIVFISASWNVTNTYTTVSETVVLNYTANQPVAMPVLSAAVGTYDMTFDAPIADTSDYTGTPVRSNTNLAYTEVLTRFPCYAVCYKSGYFDILSQYDILIIDPYAAHAADVIAWQTQGIKVYGYISSGEESGFYSNRYDFGSALAPNAGSSPGGHATYFMYTQTPNGLPDQDGMWPSYYCNPDTTITPTSWPTRIANYYAPQVLGGPVTVTAESLTVTTATISSGSVLVFDTAQSPIDTDHPIIVTTFDGSHTYTTYSDYTFDAKTGAFVLSATISPAVTAGEDKLKISYTRKGHSCDGVFFDTVDTPDVYAGGFGVFPVVDGYATKFAAMINNFKTAYPAADIIANRGFTILPQIINSCKGVMFEAWLTTATDLTNLFTTDYMAITDAPMVAANDSYNILLRQLRLTHEFDVYSLNYCHTDSRGDALRAYCKETDREMGYLSWTNTMTLDSPQANAVPFTRYKVKSV